MANGACSALLRHIYVKGGSLTHLFCARLVCATNHNLEPKGQWELLPLRFAGSKAKLFYLWCAQRRMLREKVWVHENVVLFGEAEMVSILGDLYICVRVVLDCSRLGWAIDRNRQFIIGISKEWIYPLLRATIGE